MTFHLEYNDVVLCVYLNSCHVSLFFGIFMLDKVVLLFNFKFAYTLCWTCKYNYCPVCKQQDRQVDHCIVSEDFKQSFMDCQLACASTLSWMWVIETLAYSNQVDVSLLMDLLQKTPKVSDTISKKAKELVSLRFLESISVLGACENSVSSDSSTKIRFDPSESCEDALRRILCKTSTSNPKTTQLETSKWDYGPFIASKRSSLAKCALQQLKDAILTESHPFASLKDHSGLLIGNQSEHRVLVDENSCDCITPRLEGSDANTQIDAANDKLISPSITNGSHLLRRRLSAQNLSPAKRKRSASTDKFGGRQLADTSMVMVSKGEGCTSGKNSRVVRKGKDGTPGDGFTSPKWLVGSDEVLPWEKQVHNWDTEVPNDKSDETLRQDQDMEEAKGDKEGFCDIKTYEDVDEPNNQKDAPYIGEGDEYVKKFPNSDAYHHDRTDITTNMNASFSPQFTDSPDFLATTDVRDLNLLADVSTRILQSEIEICSSSNEVHVGGMVHKGPSEDGINKPNLLKRLAGLDEFFPCEKQAPHCDVEREQDRDIGDAEGDKKGVSELKTNNEGIEPEKNILENVLNVGETDNSNIACDNDGYHDEQTDNPELKNAFLSSQCTYNQDSWANADWRVLAHCIKCNKGEKLLVCSSDPSLLVIHESCLGSGATFDTRSRKQSKEKSCSSYGMIQNHFEQDEPIKNFVEKVKKHQSRKKLENKWAGFSVLSSFDNIDSVNGIANNLNEDKLKENWMGQESQSLRAPGQHQMTALANCKSHGDNMEIRCKKRVLCRSETDLHSDNTFSPSTESTYAEEMSVEENENSGASKNVRVGKQERQSSSPENSQLRRKRVMWTVEEELKLKEGMERFCGPEDRIIPWKKILEFGADVFHESRSTIDLKDKYRNVCKAVKKLELSSDEFVKVP